MADTVLLQKEIDKSVLYQGLSIPSFYQKLFIEKLGIQLGYGQSIVIYLILDGIKYEVTLKNQKYNKDKYQKHVDVMQIRYNENSDLAKARHVKHGK